MVAPLKVGIAGLGTVGAEVIRQIEREGRVLAQRCGRGVRVVAVTARSKNKKRQLDLRGVDWAKSPLALANDPAIDCFVELMGRGRAGVVGRRSGAAQRQIRRHRQ